MSDEPTHVTMTEDGHRKLVEMQVAYDRAMASVRDQEERRAAALTAAGPWPRWRCRIGWHKPVDTIDGSALGSFYERRECVGCDAYWLSRNFGPWFRADRS